MKDKEYLIQSLPGMGGEWVREMYEEAKGERMIEYTLHGKCRSYSEVPKGAKIESVNGKKFVSFCESCKKPILKNQKYYLWADGIFTCYKCGKPS